MRTLILALLLVMVCPIAWATPTAQGAEGDGWVTRVVYPAGPLQVTLLNYEQPRGKPFLIAHFEIRNPSADDARCDWTALVDLQTAGGDTLSPNHDPLVDSGNGLTRATGPFLVPRKGKVRASLLFLLGSDSLPGFLVLPDGRRSARIDPRGSFRP